ncbi:MAG TPA: hypothetical protein VII99_10615 [Bacteroidia bacterium]
MTREEFLALRPGDKISGRSNGIGDVVSQGTSLHIKWRNSNILTFPIHELCVLWRSWTQSPMNSWSKL